MLLRSTGYGMDAAIKMPGWRIVRISKRNGQFRTLYIPNDVAKLQSLKCLPELKAILAAHKTVDANYAFEPHKNCVLNALQHVGYRYTLSVDIEDFFDSVSEASVAHLIPEELRKHCFVEGFLRQGFPSSPVISNIAFAEVDAHLMRLVADLPASLIPVMYTRYADDLIFSYDDERFGEVILGFLPLVLGHYGFRLNERKTRLQCSHNGRRIITGIAVDDTGIYPTRKVLKKIRAALHQQNETSAQGLMEWARCKLPVVWRSKWERSVM